MSLLIEKIYPYLISLGDGYHSRKKIMLDNNLNSFEPLFDRKLCFDATEEELDELEQYEIEFCKQIITSGHYRSPFIKELNNKYSQPIPSYSLRTTRMFHNETEKFQKNKQQIQREIWKKRKQETEFFQLGYWENFKKINNRSCLELINRLLQEKLPPMGFNTNKRANNRFFFLYTKKINNYFIYLRVDKNSITYRPNFFDGLKGTLLLSFGITNDLKEITEESTCTDNKIEESIALIFPTRRDPFWAVYTYFSSLRDLEIILQCQLTLYSIISDAIDNMTLSISS